MKQFIQILRPTQWLKNVFVFAPAFFSNNLLNITYFTQSVLVFISFCLVSSSIYCINDINDADADRNHPKKCKRPIASGKLSKKTAAIIAGFCFLISNAVLLMVPDSNEAWLLATILAYWIMNVLYCFKLKQFAIVDVFCIAFGFVLRVLIGGLATGIWISQWIVLLTFLIALLI